MITPKHLSYEKAELFSQHANGVVKRCSVDTLRIIRAKLADIVEHSKNDSIESEIYFLRGVIVHEELNNRQSGENLKSSLNRLWDSNNVKQASRHLCTIRYPKKKNKRTS